MYIVARPTTSIFVVSSRHQPSLSPPRPSHSPTPISQNLSPCWWTWITERLLLRGSCHSACYRNSVCSSSNQTNAIINMSRHVPQLRAFSHSPRHYPLSTEKENKATHDQQWRNSCSRLTTGTPRERETRRAHVNQPEQLFVWDSKDTIKQPATNEPCQVVVVVVFNGWAP